MLSECVAKMPLGDYYIIAGDFKFVEMPEHASTLTQTLLGILPLQS